MRFISALGRAIARPFRWVAQLWHRDDTPFDANEQSSSWPPHWHWSGHAKHPREFSDRLRRASEELGYVVEVKEEMTWAQPLASVHEFQGDLRAALTEPQVRTVRERYPAWRNLFAASIVALVLGVAWLGWGTDVPWPLLTLLPAAAAIASGALFFRHLRWVERVTYLVYEASIAWRGEAYPTNGWDGTGSQAVGQRADIRSDVRLTFRAAPLLLDAPEHLEHLLAGIGAACEGTTPPVSAAGNGASRTPLEPPAASI